MFGEFRIFNVYKNPAIESSNPNWSANINKHFTDNNNSDTTFISLGIE